MRVIGKFPVISSEPRHTNFGSLLFAWVYTEWNYNIWAPVFLHMLMNFAWELFSAGDNALGGIYSNVFRVITIALIIFLTIIFKRKQSSKLAVNKPTIWMKKDDDTD
jgi:hypothetical protein